MYEQDDELKDIHKIILVGDASTGKTHLSFGFIKEKLPNNIPPTVAVEFASKVVTLDNNRKVKAQIWDTAGQETYRALTMNHYRKMNGAFIVFDVSRRSSFEHVSYWLQNLREKGEIDMQIGLIGHKIDSSRREVSTQQAEQLAGKQHIFYAQTTIKDIGSINMAFKKLLTNMSNTEGKDNVARNDFQLGQGQSERSGCSC